MTSTRLVCAACGTGLPSDSKFCNKCGTPVAPTICIGGHRLVVLA
jgi:rRNA maturation endonuclease Nob1